MPDNFINYNLVLQTRDRWILTLERLLSERITYWIPISDLYRLRKKFRNRNNSLEGSAHLNYCSIGKKKKEFRKKYPLEYVDGLTKWNQLIESMKIFGWLETHPALILISNRSSAPKIRDGHHRLGVALEIKLDICPVQFKYEWKDNDTH